MKPADLLARIERRLEALGMSERQASQLAKRPDLIRNIRKAVRAQEPYDPRAGSVEALAGVLKTTSEWLLHGVGEETISDIETLRSIVRDMETRPTKRAHSLGGSVQIREIDITAGLGGGGMPVAEMREVIGTESYGVDAVRGYWSFPDFFLKEMSLDPRYTDILRADGISMIPDIMPGDRVIVDRRRRIPSPAGFYAIWDGFSVVIKSLQLIPNSDPTSVRIISSNNIFPTDERTLEEIAIIGMVRHVIRQV